MLSPFSLNGFQYQFLIYVPSIACVFSSNFETATKIFVQANKNNYEEEPTVVNTIPIIRIIKIIMQILG